MSKVLVIDDDPIFRRLAQMILKKREITVCDADNAEDGIALIRQENPDAVFLDVAMPGTDGLEALALIRKDPEIAGIKVFFLTGAEEETVKQKAEELGAAGFISKPFTADMLYRALELG
ncbi:MAG: response regulator [Lachnospiraceae bacterium]|nr:response regulator [Lachnospiraceae bacterium]